MDFIALLGMGFASVGFFLSSFYLLRNKFNYDGYLFLYLALGVVSYEVFYKTLIHSQLIYDFLLLYSPKHFFNLLIYPFFLFFIWTLSRKAYKLSRTHFGLIIILVAYAIYPWVYGLTISFEDKKNLLDLFYQDTRPGPYNYWGNWQTLLQSTLIPIGFLTVIGYNFFRYKGRLTNIQNKRLLNFIALIIVLYFLFYQFSNLFYLWGYQATGFSMIEWPIDILFLSIIILLFSIVTLSVNSGDSFFPPSKYQSSSLDKNTYEAILTKVKKRIEEEQLFKNEKLTVAELAHKIDTNPKYLSQTLNDHMEISFADFLNKYRVEEAQKLLLDEEHKSLTIEAIGQMAGFKSKSSFFRAFKKFTSLTPNQYIKSADKPTK
ncbi:MAG: helix-turn-helix domain-containing protein [Chitinophagales bacterium]|nr:helix-turn-helix domain-containing protein [Chitinophagales bacterium]